jgi:hypothetical protein
MLAPDHRSLYTDALRAPPGWKLDHAVATTYSLDLTTLLAFPLHLALFDAGEKRDALLRDSVALLEALRRTTSHLTVFCQQGEIHAPNIPRMLFSLLEPVIVQAKSPRAGGAFHAKLWLLRFVSGTNDVRLRLVIPTRNITHDRCWDLVLQLEGTPRGRVVANNRELKQILDALPQYATQALSVERADRMGALADEANRTQWELPGDFTDVIFHALPKRRDWLLPQSSRLVVISPFLSEPALREMIVTSRDPVALISREDQLEAIPAETLHQFDRLLVLRSETDPEDASEVPRNAPPQWGLHAKAYVLEDRGTTHVLVGSANATSAAIGLNVEIMAELIGRRIKVGGIDDLLGVDSLGAVLTDYTPPVSPVTVPAEIEIAEKVLRDVQLALAEAPLIVRCTAIGGEEWQSSLECAVPVRLEGLASLRAWPVCRSETTVGVDGLGLARGESLHWSPGRVETLTGLIAFEATAESADATSRFVLNLPVEGLPSAERGAAILRSILANREGFLRYLLLLLAEEDDLLAGAIPGDDGDGGQWMFRRWSDAMPILEEMTRALHRDRNRLFAIRRLVQELGRRTDDEIVPEEFVTLWDVFERVLAEVGS